PPVGEAEPGEGAGGPIVHGVEGAADVDRAAGPGGERVHGAVEHRRETFIDPAGVQVEREQVGAPHLPGLAGVPHPGERAADTTFRPTSANALTMPSSTCGV